MRTKLLLLTVTAAHLFGAAASVSAQAPTTFLYQGRLTDANDQPIATATSVTFAIVAVASGVDSLPLYDTVASVTPNDNGVFTIELGPLPDSVFTGSQRYLSVTVGDTELLPRQLITSVPYSMRAEYVPGVAYSTRNRAMLMTNAVQPIDSVTITVPCSGYVLVEASGFFEVVHISRVDIVQASVNTVRDSLEYDNYAVFAAESGDSGNYCYDNFAIHAMYSVTAGTHTYYLNGQQNHDSSNSSVQQAHLVATFYPEAYGTVTLPSPRVITPEMNIGPDGLPIDASRPGR